MHLEIYKNQEVVRRSRNLRGLIDYARSHGVKSVTIRREGPNHPQGFPAQLLVIFHDGAGCLTHFADFTVLCGWLRSRRSWHGADCYVRDVHVGRIDKKTPMPLPRDASGNVVGDCPYAE